MTLFFIALHERMQVRNNFGNRNLKNLRRFCDVNFNFAAVRIKNLFSEQDDESVTGFQSFAKFLADSQALAIVQYYIPNLKLFCINSFSFFSFVPS